MATLGESFCLLGEGNSEGTIYVEGDGSPNSIIVTTSHRHISVYDVRSTLPLHSWTLPSGQSVTGGAVFDETSSQYMAVIDKQLIRKWTKDDVSLKKTKKVNVSKPVHRLITRGQFEPLVVYTDGSAAWLRTPDHFLCGPQGDTPGCVTWVDATIFNNEFLLVMLMARKGKDGKDKVVVFTIKTDSVSVHGRLVENVGCYASSACLCLSTSPHSISLLALDKSGNLTETPVSASSATYSRQLHKLPAGGDTCSILSLSSSHLAVSGITAPSGEVCLGIWDIKFGILQAWKPLPLSHMDQTHLLCHGSNIVLMSQKGLYTHAYTVRPSTLGAALGKVTSPPADHRNVSSDCISKCLSSLTDPSQTPTHKAFTQAFNELLKEVKAAKHVELLSHHHQMAALVERSIAEKKFWPREELLMLIKEGYIPTRLIGQLTQALTSRSELELICACVEHLPDLPEVAIGECLRFFLRTEESTFTGDVEVVDEQTEKKLTSSNPFVASKAAQINALLGRRYNDIFLVGEIRKLDFQHCLNVLQYLHFLLESGSICDTDKSFGSLTLIKVVDWINLLVDAHFQQMVLSAEAHQLLLDLHQTVESQVVFYNELVGLETILAQIIEKCTLPQKQPPGLYNIHVLHI